MPNIHALIIPGLGGAELIWLVVIVVLLLFGAKKIPELARSMGRAKGEFEMGKVEADKEAKTQIAKKESPEEERTRLENAAKALGINVEGMSIEELREAIRQRT